MITVNILEDYEQVNMINRLIYNRWTEEEIPGVNIRKRRIFSL